MLAQAEGRDQQAPAVLDVPAYRIGHRGHHCDVGGAQIVGQTIAERVELLGQARKVGRAEQRLAWLDIPAWEDIDLVVVAGYQLPGCVEEPQHQARARASLQGWHIEN